MTTRLPPRRQERACADGTEGEEEEGAIYTRTTQIQGTPRENAERKRATGNEMEARSEIRRYDSSLGTPRTRNSLYFPIPTRHRDERGNGGRKGWRWGQGLEGRGREERAQTTRNHAKRTKQGNRETKQKASEPIFPFVASTRCFALLSSIVLCPK